MATIKSFTDLSQSKVLSKILPLESADMCYEVGEDLDGYVTKTIYTPLMHTPYNDDYIPCWSLAALLNYLKNKNKFPEIKELSDGRFKLTTYIWNGEDCIQVSTGDTIIDACYELILKLNELNLL